MKKKKERKSKKGEKVIKSLRAEVKDSGFGVGTGKGLHRTVAGET